MLGLFIVPGSEMPARLLAAVPDLQGGSSAASASAAPAAGNSSATGAGAAAGSRGGTPVGGDLLGSFQLLKADVKDPLVRQFVGGLVTGISPVPEFAVLASREVLHAGKGVGG